MLKIGDTAPDFSLQATNGETMTLSRFKGKPVLVYFYPKDDTPGCTKEACDFRDNTARIEKAGIQIFGISKDDNASHKKFADKFQLNFPLLSDETGGTIEAYGAWKEKSMFRKTFLGIQRMTFLIDAQGQIAKIWPQVDVTNHVDEVLAAAEKLQTAQAA